MESLESSPKEDQAPLSREAIQFLLDNLSAEEGQVPVGINCGIAGNETDGYKVAVRLSTDVDPTGFIETHLRDVPFNLRQWGVVEAQEDITPAGF